MILLKRSYFTFLLFILALACSSSEKAMDSEPITPEITNESTLQEQPEIEIQLIVNERVKYEFKKTEDVWDGTVIQFSSSDPESREIVRTISIEPTMGWEDFEIVLDFLEIYTLPDQSEIEDRVSGPITAISRSYTFTISKNDATRSFHYYNPEGEVADHWQSQNVVTFGTYLTTEMKVIQE